MTRLLYRLAAACCNNLAFAVAILLWSIGVGILGARHWAFLFLNLVPTLALMLTLWLTGGRCPLPRWRARLLQRAATCSRPTATLTPDES